MPEQKHQLAAIMFTDIVGYTAMMGENEASAYQLLKKNRLVQKPLIEKYGGIWLKEMGDGVLASFSTVSDAVYCAIEIQETCLNEPDLKLRIGLHQGEVIVEDGDVFGDGVNIASRLEPLAPIGGIYISESVFRNIENKEGIKADFVREETLKNVRHPVRIYSVKVKGIEPINQRIEKSKGKVNKTTLAIAIPAFIIFVSAILIYYNYSNREKSKNESDEFIEIALKSIAVIPFWNDSPDPDNAYFCSGMEEEIRIHLFKIGDLRLESRQSVEKYRQNPEKDLITIGKELDVAYIVEGSVRKVNNDIRITVQLIDATTGDHVWGETYDGDYTKELLDFQARTAMQIANEMNAVIKPEEGKLIERLPTSIIAAYDLRIRGNFEYHEYWRTFDKAHAQYAHQLLDSAIIIDPELIEAYIDNANVYVAEGKFDSVSIYTDKAIKIEPENRTIYTLKGRSYIFQRKYKLSVDNYLKAIELTPYPDGILLSELGRSYGWQKNGTEMAFQQFNKAYGINNTTPEQVFFFIAINYTHTGDYKNAEKYFLKNLSNREQVPESSNIGLYAWNLIVQARYDEAISFLDSTCQVYNYPLQCERFKFITRLISKDFENASQNLEKLMALGMGNDLWQFGDTRWGWWMLDNMLLAYFYNETGKKEQALVLLSETQLSLEKLLKEDQSYVPFLNLSAIHSIRNEKEEALQFLTDAVDAGLMIGWHDLISTHPVFENLWDTPQFKILLNLAREEKARDRERINAMRDAGELVI